MTAGSGLGSPDHPSGLSREVADRALALLRRIRAGHYSVRQSLGRADRALFDEVDQLVDGLEPPALGSDPGCHHPYGRYLDLLCPACVWVLRLGARRGEDHRSGCQSSRELREQVAQATDPADSEIVARLGRWCAPIVPLQTFQTDASRALGRGTTGLVVEDVPADVLLRASAVRLVAAPSASDRFHVVALHVGHRDVLADLPAHELVAGSPGAAAWHRLRPPVVEGDVVRVCLTVRNEARAPSAFNGLLFLGDPPRQGLPPGGVR